MFSLQLGPGTQTNASIFCSAEHARYTETRKEFIMFHTLLHARLAVGCRQVRDLHSSLVRDSPWACVHMDT